MKSIYAHAKQHGVAHSLSPGGREGFEVCLSFLSSSPLFPHTTRTKCI